MDMVFERFSCRKNAFFQASIKLAQPFPNRFIIFTLFRTFSEFFPQDFPLKNKGFELKENKREEKIK